MERNTLCTFCCKSCENNETGISSEDNSKLNRFLTLLERYLEAELFSKFNLNYWFICEGCLKTVKSFCDLYYDLKTIELLMNQQLLILNDKIKNTLDFPCKGSNEKLEEFRNEFLNKCSRKLHNSYPRLILKKINSPSTPPLVTALDNQNGAYHSQEADLAQASPPPPSPPSSPLDTRLDLEEFQSSPTPIEANSNVEHSTELLKGSESTSRTIPEEVNVDTVVKITSEELIKQLLEKKTSPFNGPQLSLFDKISEESEPNAETASSPNKPEVKSQQAVLKVPEAPDGKEGVPVSPTPRRLRSVHQCSNCQKTFAKPESLSSHQKTCAPRDCNEEENDKEMEQDSDYVVEANGPNEDDDDASEAEGTDNPSDVEEPENPAEPGRPWKCSFCPREFSQRPKFKSHVATQHPEKSDFVVPFAGKKIPQVQILKCPACEKTFKKLHQLLLHYKTHSEDTSNLVEILTVPKGGPPQPFAKIEIPLKPAIEICPVETCKRPFYSKEDFETHQKLHGSFNCAKCSKMKTFLPELSAHEVKEHGGVEKCKIKCQRCPAIFTEFVSYLRHHSSEHFSLGFKEQSCPICKTYLKKYELDRKTSTLFKHFKTAHDLDGKIESKQFGLVRCSESDCQAYFMNTSSLTYHRKVDHQLEQSKLEEIRTGRERRVCEQCGKSFRDAEKLKQHSLSHAGPQSWEFSCEVCGKKCPTNQKLQEHLRTHTKEKPFICEVCGAAYAHRHNLRLHVNSKHGDVIKDDLSSKKGVKRKKSEKNDDTKRKRKAKLKKEVDTDDDGSDFELVDE